MLARTLGLIVDGVPLSVALTFGGEGGGDAEGEATAQADASVGAAVGGGVTVPVFGAGAAARAAVTNTTEAGIKAIEVSLTAVLLSPIVALLEIAAIWLEVGRRGGSSAPAPVLRNPGPALRVPYRRRPRSDRALAAGRATLRQWAPISAFEASPRAGAVGSPEAAMMPRYRASLDRSAVQKTLPAFTCPVK